MANRVEEQITAIEQYLDECKYVQFSSTMIKVDKEKLMDMLADLRGNMPEEMARYRKVINERDRILSEARRKAQELVDRTEAQTNELVGNQEIMQQAYAQANEIVALSSQRAQQIEDDAVNDANHYRMAAVQYMDQMLAGMEAESKECIRETAADISGADKSAGSDLCTDDRCIAAVLWQHGKTAGIRLRAVPECTYAVYQDAWKQPGGACQYKGAGRHGSCRTECWKHRDGLCWIRYPETREQHSGVTDRFYPAGHRQPFHGWRARMRQVCLLDERSTEIRMGAAALCAAAPCAESQMVIPEP